MIDPDDTLDEIDVEGFPRWNIADVRRVQDTMGAEIIDGTLCDVFSTAVIIPVWELLRPDLQQQAHSLPFGIFAQFCWKQVDNAIARKVKQP